MGDMTSIDGIYDDELERLTKEKLYQWYIHFWNDLMDDKNVRLIMYKFYGIEDELHPEDYLKEEGV
jgi:hypothetical protein